MNSSRPTESGAQLGPLALPLLTFFPADNEDQGSETHEAALANQDKEHCPFQLRLLWKHSLSS